MSSIIRVPNEMCANLQNPWIDLFCLGVDTIRHHYGSEWSCCDNCVVEVRVSVREKHQPENTKWASSIFESYWLVLYLIMSILSHPSIIYPQRYPGIAGRSTSYPRANSEISKSRQKLKICADNQVSLFPCFSRIAHTHLKNNMFECTKCGCFF